MGPSKVCKTCGIEKPSSEFYQRDDTKDKLHTKCKSCHIKNSRKNYIKTQYGITKEEYDELINIQKNKCPICYVDFSTIPSKNIHIEHNHKTGVIRGITCQWCNIMIGFSRDSPEILLNAFEYLTK